MMPPEPPRIAALPRCPKRDIPVPWFVQWLDDGKPCDVGQGIPDFRIADKSKIVLAHRYELCWICGERRGSFKSFVIGPMCAINHIAPEPPSHTECADYSARACPFLVKPFMVRREKGLPEDRLPAAGGVMIDRNPGVALVWTTKKYRPMSDGKGGVVFLVGPPTETRWYCEGRPATRAEVKASVDSGIHYLEGFADGPEEHKALAAARVVAEAYWPAS
jgi:hypothetical protein